jgi:hypothetical protein
MNWWQVINSPIILTMLGLLWGSFVAARITALWQKRSHHYQVKLKYAQDVISAHQRYIRLLKNEESSVSGEEFDELHSRMVSYAKIAKFLFTDAAIGKGWQSVVDRLTSIRGLRIDKRNISLVEKKLKDVYPEANDLIERMFKELV